MLGCWFASGAVERQFWSSAHTRAILMERERWNVLSVLLLVLTGYFLGHPAKLLANKPVHTFISVAGLSCIALRAYLGYLRPDTFWRYRRIIIVGNRLIRIGAGILGNTYGGYEQGVRRFATQPDLTPREFAHVSCIGSFNAFFAPINGFLDFSLQVGGGKGRWVGGQGRGRARPVLCDCRQRLLRPAVHTPWAGPPRGRRCRWCWARCCTTF
jgi:hypothetical protein